MNDYKKTNYSETQLTSEGLLSRFHQLWSSLISWVCSRPKPGEQRWANLIRMAIGIHFIVFQEFRRDLITLRASALTYTIVLSLVPILALSTAVLKGLGAGDQMREAAYKFIDQLELTVDTTQESKGQTLPSADSFNSLDSDQDRANAEESSAKGLTVHLREAADQVFNYVEHTNFATLGAFGILGLVIATIIVMDSIEQAMNTIWQAESSRPIGRKIMDYLALMILLPISINTAMATMATLHSQSLLIKLEKMLPFTWLGPTLLNMVPIVLLVATFTILYRFLPNTKVNIYPALIGGICGGIGWLIIQIIYIKLQIGVARYNTIYGSFATLPLFLVWMQMGWVVFLAGAEMAFAVQVWPNYIWGKAATTPATKLALAFDIMEAALADFHERRTTDLSSLTMRLKQPDAYISSVLESLLHKGLLRKVDGERDQFVPAAPAENINPAEIVDIIYGTEVPSSSGGLKVKEGLKALKSALAEKKILN
jgi:membrane protein